MDIRYKKIEHAKKNGYDVLVLWEYDIKNDINLITEKLMAYVKEN